MKELQGERTSTMLLGNFNTSLSEIDGKGMKYLNNIVNTLELYKTYIEYATNNLVTYFSTNTQETLMKIDRSVNSFTQNNKEANKQKDFQALI